MKKQLLWILPAILLLFASCSSDNKSYMPSITGAAGEVVLVIDKAVIDDSITLAVRSHLEAEYPMIPQEEPLFNVALVPTNNFTDIFRSHRNIVLVKVDNSYSEAKIVVQRDVWSAPQIVVNLVGPTYPAIEKMLEKESNRFIQLIEQAERDRTVRNAKKYEVEAIRKHVEKKFGMTMYFPKGYTVNLDTTDFSWISYETPRTSQGIFVYQYPYTDENTFTQEYLVSKRDEFVNRYIMGPTGNSYMSTETLIPAEFSGMTFDNRYFGRLRGLWTVIGHPMGGPFISLSTVDEENNRVVTVEGYVFAPRLDKRNYLRQVEALLLAAKLQNE